MGQTASEIVDKPVADGKAVTPTARPPASSTPTAKMPTPPTWPPSVRG